MRRLPALGLALAVVASLGAGTAAAAKPKVPCNNVTDVAGDVAAYGDTGSTPDDALDLLSADIGANARGVTAVIRVKKLAVPAPTSPLSTVYELRLSHQKSGDTYSLYAIVSASGTTYGVGVVDETAAALEPVTSSGSAKGTVDLAKNEIRITAPYSALGGAKKGIKASIGTVAIKRSVPTRFEGRYADSTVFGGSGGKSQILGATTCVKPEA